MSALRIARLDQYGLLQAAGDDARSFLHAQLTNDIENLGPGQARYAGWCSAKGRLLATFLVVPHAGGFLLQLSRDLVPAVAKRLSMFVLRSKVKISDVSAQWVQYGVWESQPGEPLRTTPAEDVISTADYDAWAAFAPGRPARSTPAGAALFAQVQGFVTGNRLPSGALPLDYFANVPLTEGFSTTNANAFDISNLPGYKLYRLRRAYATSWGTLRELGLPRYIQFGLKIYF